MSKLFKKIQNLGIDSNTDLETAKRLRLCNDMSIAGITVGCIVLGYAILKNWPFNLIITICFLLLTTFIPPILNFYKKIVASRVSYLIISIIIILYLCIFLGPNFHFQYFLFGIIGLPLMFFGVELDRKSSFWAVIVVIVFFYLEYHFIAFKPLNDVNQNYKPIQLLNGIIVLLSLLNQFYWLVTENHGHVKEIKAKSTELEEKNNQLERFVSLASHDLKAPLRNINSFFGLIRLEFSDHNNEDLNNYFSLIDQGFKKMWWMINNFLVYSRIGKSGDYETVDMNTIVSSFKTNFEKIIEASNATIKADNLPVISCRPFEIEQLFQNLIFNAIKFKQPKVAPVIEFTCADKNSYWQFCVADNGIGISAEKHKEIFEMFTKLHLPEKYEGNGVGLAFCKKIVEAHNGKIWVESSPGKGSRFYFTVEKNL